MDDGGTPHLISVVSWGFPVRCIGTRLRTLCLFLHKGDCVVPLSLGSALSASVADSLSALLGDCRIWGSEEDPHFPVDRLLFKFVVVFS